MDLLVAFGTDDGESLNNDHVGMAKCFYVYAFTEGEEGLVEKRENVEFKEDESIKHGDPKKAKATSSVLEGVECPCGQEIWPQPSEVA